MNSYRTVIRIEHYKESLGLVWATMIAWQLEPFWYPANPFLDVIAKRSLLTASHRNPLRFICDANIYAHDIASLDIKNVSIAEPPPEEWL